jgi:hypothetical protein
MEIAAGLELKADGRFRYGLSYGALDEEATGKWTMSGDQVLLTSDPVTAPRSVLVSHGKAVDGVLQLSLDVPKGLSRQYFDAVIAKRSWQGEFPSHALKDSQWRPFVRPAWANDQVQTFEAVNSSTGACSLDPEA